MARLTARILKLERRLPIGIEAELRALSDEQLKVRIARLTGVSVEEVRAWTPEDFRRLKDELLAAQSFPGGFDQAAYAARPSPLRGCVGGIQEGRQDA